MLSKEIKQSILEKLLIQYKNYSDVSNEIRDLKFKLLKAESSERENLKNKIDFLTQVLDRLSDEMSFPAPSIWIMYKYEAYKNTDKGIKYVQDFIDHCTPDGYICTERFKFINKYLPENFWAKVQDDLSSYLDHAEIIKLENEPKFMEVWLSNEFKIINNKFSKWK